MKRKECNDIAVAAMEALRKVLEPMGYNVEQNGGTYSDLDFKMKIRITPGEQDTKRIEFEQSCEYYGLLPADYGREFTYGGDRFKITGFNHNAPRYPIRATRLRDNRPMRLDRICLGRVREARRETV